MDVIPVIDIRDGVAVRAVAGRRAAYRPLETPLARSSAPRDVAVGLMSLHPFRALYVADLDAIENRGDNRAAVRAVSERFPYLPLWVDAGLRRAEDARDWRAMENVAVVFGSETIATLKEFETMSGIDRAILSLDFREGTFLGPNALLVSPAIWPRRVIVMTLDRVGARTGPDLARVAQIRSRAADCEVIAAGGVRGVEDLLALKQAGATGTLVATALHEGRLTTNDFARLSAK